MLRDQDLIVVTPEGLYCPPGGFHLDPWRKVSRALISHAHSDHARPGSGAYLLAASGQAVARERIGQSAAIETLSWGEPKVVNGVEVSFHPAGHLLGSAQIRISYRGQIWVYTGDFKRTPDPSCESFEPVPCHTLITESTFGLPIYTWPDPSAVFESIHQWWADNQRHQRTSIIFAYALGKAQRLLAGLNSNLGPIGVHGSVARFLPHYENAGYPLAPALRVTQENQTSFVGKGLIIAPGSTAGSPWLRKFGESSLAFASGWVLVRGNRRQRALDRGFVLSDHADWPDLLQTVRDTGASRVLPTHGYTVPFSRYLREQGIDAEPLETPFSGEEGEVEEE
ncbi:MAG: ligase-associated DNA damage response exonuclease [Puniceicoccaceae bacterium]